MPCLTDSVTANGRSKRKLPLPSALLTKAPLTTRFITQYCSAVLQNAPSKPVVVATVAAHKPLRAEPRRQAAAAEHVLAGVHSRVVVTRLASSHTKRGHIL